MDHFVVEYCVVILGACEHTKMKLRGWADDGGGAKDGRALLMSQCVCQGPAQDDFHWWTAVSIITLCSQTHTHSRPRRGQAASTSLSDNSIRHQTQAALWELSHLQPFTAPIFRYIFVETCFFFISMVFHEVALFALLIFFNLFQKPLIK